MVFFITIILMIHFDNFISKIENILYDIRFGFCYELGYLICFSGLFSLKIILFSKAFSQDNNLHEL